MTRRKRKLIAWWWGRIIPKSHKHLTNLSNLSSDQINELQTLKDIFLYEQGKGIELSWGKQVTAKDFFNK